MPSKKKRIKRPQKQAKKRLTPATQNGIMIQDLMKSQGIKGNYKDFVVLSPQGVVHWSGTFTLHRNDNGEKLDIPAIAIVHKRELFSILGPEIGEMFWKKGGRVLTTY